jgi:NDP-sugar pyrophosphorylase family protein
MLSGAIIAAGRGERLRAATAGLPKPLVELDGKALLIRQIDLMQQYGCDCVYVIVNTETAALLGRRRIALPSGVELLVADTSSSMESLLTLGARIPTGRFLLATVDAVVTVGEFTKFGDRALRLAGSMRVDPFDGALAVVKWRGDARPLFVEVAADGSISRFRDESGDLVTAGLYLLPTRIFEHVDEARALGLDALRRFLAFLLGKGLRFGTVELSGVVDVDEGSDLEQARTLLSS